MKNKYIFVVCVLLFSCVEALCSQEVRTTKEAMQQAHSLFSTFELKDKQLTEQQGKAVANVVRDLLLHRPTYPSGQYLALVGDGKYYLGDFGEALLFWRSAELRLPYDTGLQKRIVLVRHVLDMNSPLVQRPIADFIGLCFLPKTMKYVVLIASWFFAFFFWSIWQWFHFRPFQYLYVVVIGIALLLSSGVSWYEWVVPPRVVVLHHTVLRASLTPQVRGDHVEYEMSTGEEGEALSFTPDKKWVRIRTATYHTGYVPGSAVGFIE